MKNLLLFSILCFFLAVMTLFFPYSYEGPMNSTDLIPISGYMNDFALFQFVLYVIITSVSSFRQNLATAAIGLILCFSFFLFFVLLSTSMLFVVMGTVELGYGFFMAAGVSVLFWGCHVANLIVVIKSPNEKRKATTDLIDEI